MRVAAELSDTHDFAWRWRGEWSVWRWCRRDVGASFTNYHGNFKEHSSTPFGLTKHPSSLNPIVAELPYNSRRNRINWKNSNWTVSNAFMFSPLSLIFCSHNSVTFGDLPWISVIRANFRLFRVCCRTPNLLPSLSLSLTWHLMFTHNNYEKTNETHKYFMYSNGIFMIYVIKSWNEIDAKKRNRERNTIILWVNLQFAFRHDMRCRSSNFRVIHRLLACAESLRVALCDVYLYECLFLCICVSLVLFFFVVFLFICDGTKSICLFIYILSPHIYLDGSGCVCAFGLNEFTSLWLFLFLLVNFVHGFYS